MMKKTNSNTSKPLGITISESLRSQITNLKSLIDLRSFIFGIVFVFLIGNVKAEQPVLRPPTTDVNSPAFRQQLSLLPSETLLFNGWGVTPAGKHVSVGNFALKMIVAPDGKTLAVVTAGFTNTGLTLLDIETSEIKQFIPLEKCWNGLAFSRDGKKLFVSGGPAPQIYVFDFLDGKAIQLEPIKPASTTKSIFLASIAIHPTSNELYVCNEANHEILVLNANTLQVEKAIAVGQHPHSCVFGADSRHLYVSNWGSRSVSIVDTEKGIRLRDITVGIRPNDMALATDGRLFVACSGDNTVHVIGTNRPEVPGPDASPARRLWDGTREIISTSLYPQSPEGSSPTALVVTSDCKTLFVANSDNNCVMVADVSNSISEAAREHQESVTVVEGFIPTGWYPTALAVTPDNNVLMIANGKGLRSLPNAIPKSKEAEPKPSKPKAYIPIGKTLDGSVSFVARPDTAQMTAYTDQVRKNSPYRPESLMRSSLESHSVIPDQVGRNCPIKHVLYIIKENRTYDQVLGDMKDAEGKPIGNGDPSICIYGEKITPNQHQLARDYVLLDNIYCNGEVSVDGHSLCDAAIATDYNQRSWTLSYSQHGKLPGNEEMETPTAGYLWDLCKRHGVSYKNYGEGAQRVPSTNRGRWRASWQDGRDMDLVDYWIQDLHEAEKSGSLPQFTIMSLGENHTEGSKVGKFTPNACVGSNDVALGKIVEAATRSKFWNEMAIFVIEDDAQNGPDHIDAHRTIGFVISPYTKRNSVDSTLYTTASMIRTMELILGLPPLTQYDAGATPMFHCFAEKPTSTPYTLLKPECDLMEKNTTASLFWKESGQMNFDEVDCAPEDELNRILWHLAKGIDAPYPVPRHGALFTK